MTPAETKLLKWALGRLSDDLGNAGCNDLHLERDVGLTEPEWREVATALNALRDEDSRDRILDPSRFMDWEVVGYLLTKIAGNE